MGSIKARIGNQTDGIAIYLQGTKGHPATPYTGSGAPWANENTTPFAIGGNSVTGAPFVLTTPSKQTTLQGLAPFTNWQMPSTLTIGNHVIEVPLQLYANNKQSLAQLVAMFRRELYATITSPHGMFLSIEYQYSLTNYRIVSANFQETPSFWHEESHNDITMMRGMLTLDCTIGYDTDRDLSNTTITNAVNNTALLANIDGDLARFGQPMEFTLTGGIITNNAKEIFMCVNDDYASSNVNETVTATPSASDVTKSAPMLSAYGRTQVLAVLSNVSANARIRMRVHWQGSATYLLGSLLYASPWITPGAFTSARLFNFGYLIPNNISGLYMVAVVEVATNNTSNAAATVGYVYMMRTRTFCRININNTTSHDALLVVSPNIGLDENNVSLLSRPHSGGVYKSRILPSPFLRTTEIVEGSLPVAIDNTGLWIGWNDNDAHNPATTANLNTSRYILLRETIGI